MNKYLDAPPRLALGLIVLQTTPLTLWVWSDWLLRWDLNPRSFGYEPNEITTSPLSDMVLELGLEPRTC